MSGTFWTEWMGLLDGAGDAVCEHLARRREIIKVLAHALAGRVEEDADLAPAQGLEADGALRVLQRHRLHRSARALALLTLTQGKSSQVSSGDRVTLLLCSALAQLGSVGVTLT